MGRLVDHSIHDRRASRRHDVTTPIRVRLWTSAIPEHAGQSEDIFTTWNVLRDVFGALSVGTVVEVLLKMPEEVSEETATEWSCTGHLV